eukprot:593440-Prorocentrum_lima.AAC.1
MRHAYDRVKRAECKASFVAGMGGARIGDTAEALDAELCAIYAYLKRVEANTTDPHNARVLVLSDCLSGLLNIEK